MYQLQALDIVCICALIHNQKGKRKDYNHFNNLICFIHLWSYLFIRLDAVLFLSGKWNSTTKENIFHINQCWQDIIVNKSRKEAG